jgi:hypothetical protein
MEMAPKRSFDFLIFAATLLALSLLFLVQLFGTSSDLDLNFAHATLEMEQAGSHTHTHTHEHAAHTHAHAHASAPPPSLLAGYRLAAEANFGQRLTYRVPLTSTSSTSSSSSSSSTTAVGRRRCSYKSCEQRTSSSDSDKLSVCGGCRAVRYCSRACQAADWRAGHRALCRPLKVAPSLPHFAVLR